MRAKTVTQHVPRKREALDCRLSCTSMAKQSMQHGDLPLQATNEYISSHEGQGTPMATKARTLEQNNIKLELGIGGVASGDRPLFLARGISESASPDLK